MLRGEVSGRSRDSDTRLNLWKAKYGLYLQVTDIYVS